MGMRLAGPRVGGKIYLVRGGCVYSGVDLSHVHLWLRCGQPSQGGNGFQEHPLPTVPTRRRRGPPCRAAGTSPKAGSWGWNKPGVTGGKERDCSSKGAQAALDQPPPSATVSASVLGAVRAFRQAHNPAPAAPPAPSAAPGQAQLSGEWRRGMVFSGWSSFAHLASPGLFGLSHPCPPPAPPARPVGNFLFPKPTLSIFFPPAPHCPGLWARKSPLPSPAPLPSCSPHPTGEAPTTAPPPPPPPAASHLGPPTPAPPPSTPSCPSPPPPPSLLPMASHSGELPQGVLLQVRGWVSGIPLCPGVTHLLGPFRAAQPGGGGALTLWGW